MLIGEHKTRFRNTYSVVIINHNFDFYMRLQNKHILDVLGIETVARIGNKTDSEFVAWLRSLRTFMVTQIL